MADARVEGHNYELNVLRFYKGGVFKNIPDDCGKGTGAVWYPRCVAQIDHALVREATLKRLEPP